MSSRTSSPRPTPNAIESREADGRVVQARLAGRSQPLDRRINAVRPDLADIALAGQVIAPRYSAPVQMRCVVPIAKLRNKASPAATQISELLFGEAFAVFDRAAGYAWGQAASDAYVGWIEAAALADAGTEPTHSITSATALRFTGPSLKSPVKGALPLGARVRLDDSGGDYLASDDGTWIHRRHVEPPTGDIVDLAQAFIGSPYHWGGRTRAGIDCSGLIQTILQAHGIACPRDSDQQQAAFAATDPAVRRRGDLIFIPGHVALLVDPDHVLHANAYWMTTLVEPLTVMLDRLATRDYAVARPPCRVMAAPL